jgi:hypothetical protein
LASTGIESGVIAHNGLRQHDMQIGEPAAGRGSALFA